MKHHRLTLLAAATLMLLATGATPSRATWKAQYAGSPNATWFEQQKDCNGNSCCGQGDGEAYYSMYEMHSDGSVTLANGTKINKCQVLDGKNPTGHAILWHSGANIYCFSLGPGF